MKGTLMAIGDFLDTHGARFLRHNAHRLSHVAGLVGAGQRTSRRLSDAQSYWGTQDGSGWVENSHWRDGIGEANWEDVGRGHLRIFEEFSRALQMPSKPDVVIDWGCGGGANAVVFAPITKRRYVAADVSGESVLECTRQIQSVCDTPTESIVIDIEHPERAVSELGGGSCDLFLCTYVLELTAGREEALRIVRLAERLLISGGMAIFQVKYHTSFRTRGYTRNYRRNLSNMTTFGIEEFWLVASECGLDPRLIELVPKNLLDSRYAYYALTKP